MSERRSATWTATPCVILLAVLAVLAPQPARAQAVYAACAWSDNAVHMLDANMANLSSFAVGSAPNGIASDGDLLYVGYFSPPQVSIYDFAGALLSTWGGSFVFLQGLEIVGSELAVQNNNLIEFYNPATGAFIRSIPSQGGTVEGLAWDGTLLWQLADQIVGTNPTDGSVVRSITNAAAACVYGGSGLTAVSATELMIGCAAGEWYRISSVDGSVLASGNNGLEMYGLTSLVVVPVELQSFTIE